MCECYYSLVLKSDKHIYQIDIEEQFVDEFNIRLNSNSVNVNGLKEYLDFILSSGFGGYSEDHLLIRTELDEYNNVQSPSVTSDLYETDSYMFSDDHVNYCPGFKLTIHPKYEE